MAMSQSAQLNPSPQITQNTNRDTRRPVNGIHCLRIILLDAAALPAVVSTLFLICVNACSPVIFFFVVS